MKGPTETLLFIGGPADGRWLSIEKGANFAEGLSEPENPIYAKGLARPVNATVTRYERLTFAYMGRKYHVMAPTGWDQERVLEKLIGGYKP